MAKCKLLMSTAQVQKLIDFFDGYEDDKVKCKFVKREESGDVNEN